MFINSFCLLDFVGEDKLRKIGKIIKIPIITKKEAEQYEPLGSPVMMPLADELNVYYFGSRMLRDYGRSLDDVIGYRILGLDEETEFRQECSCFGQVVRYYGAKNQD